MRTKTLILSLISMMMPLSILCAAADSNKEKVQKPVYTKIYKDSKLNKKARKWVRSGAWRNGFTKASPDGMVNLTDFYLQYNANPEPWVILFRWLQETDLLAIPRGKHKIPGSELVASVEDSENEAIEKRKSESHKLNIDFMYVVSGTEGFLRLDHNTSTVSVPYKPDVMRYSYAVEKAERIESKPGRFIIMFPDDWHVAKVKTGLEDQKIRVIVVKMPYKE